MLISVCILFFFSLSTLNKIIVIVPTCLSIHRSKDIFSFCFCFKGVTQQTTLLSVIVKLRKNINSSLPSLSSLLRVCLTGFFFFLVNLSDMIGFFLEFLGHPVKFMETEDGKFVFDETSFFYCFVQTAWALFSGGAEYKPLQFLAFAFVYRIFEKLKASEPAVSPSFTVC